MNRPRPLGFAGVRPAQTAVGALVAVIALGGCGGSGHGAPKSTATRPAVLVGSDVDDLSTATPGSCRKYIREIEAALRTRPASADRLALRATLAQYRSALAQNPQAGCVDPIDDVVYYEGRFSSTDAQTNPVAPVTP